MIRPPRGFQTMKTAATLARSEITRMISRGQSTQRKCQAKGAVCIVNQLIRSSRLNDTFDRVRHALSCYCDIAPFSFIDDF
jgi:hypothetical protein